MNDDELNRALLDEDDIMPSSGFVSSVMESVYREATEPPPIPFPWKRALPGIVLSLTLMAVFLMSFLNFHSAAIVKWNSVPKDTQIEMASWLSEFERAAIHSGAGWVLLALGLSFVTWKLSMMLVMRRG
jgi:hypothetical protein